MYKICELSSDCNVIQELKHCYRDNRPRKYFAEYDLCSDDAMRYAEDYTFEVDNPSLDEVCEVVNKMYLDYINCYYSDGTLENMLCVTVHYGADGCLRTRNRRSDVHEDLVEELESDENFAFLEDMSWGKVHYVRVRVSSFELEEV